MSVLPQTDEVVETKVIWWVALWTRLRLLDSCQTHNISYDVKINPFIQTSLQNLFGSAFMKTMPQEGFHVVQ